MNHEKEKRLEEIRQKYLKKYQQTFQSFKEEFPPAQDGKKIDLQFKEQGKQKHNMVELKSYNVGTSLQNNKKETGGRRYLNKNIREKIITLGNSEGKQNEIFSKQTEPKLSSRELYSPIKQIYESPQKEGKQIWNPSKNCIKPFSVAYSPSPLKGHRRSNTGGGGSISQKYDEYFSKLQSVQQKIKCLFEEEKLRK